MRGSRWMALVAVMAGAVAAGCGAEASGAGGLTAATDTIDGNARLTYPGEGGLALTWAVDTIARIGDVLGDDDAYQFDRVTPTGVDGDAKGNVYVLDGAGKRVLSYDAEGRHRATYGRSGEGPGELSNPFALALGAADTIWVLDPFNTRITGYPNDGTDARTITLTDLAGFPNPGFALRAGGFVMQSTPPIRFGSGGRGSFTMAAPAGRSRGGASPAAGRSASGAEPESVDNRIPVFRVGMDGASSDTLWHSEPPPMNVVQMGSGSGSSNMVVMAMPPRYQPGLRWAAFSDGGIAVLDTDRYEFSLVAPDGTVRHVIARNMPAWPVGEAEKETAREAVRNSNVSIGGAKVDMAPFIEKQLASMTFAATVPRIAKIGIDSEDRIWVGVSLTTPLGTDRVDIFAKDGLFLGSLEGAQVPDAFFAGGRALSIVKDPDTDVQQIAVLQIRERAR